MSEEENIFFRFWSTFLHDSLKLCCLKLVLVIICITKYGEEVVFNDAFSFCSILAMQIFISQFTFISLTHQRSLDSYLSDVTWHESYFYTFLSQYFNAYFYQIETAVFPKSQKITFHNRSFCLAVLMQQKVYGLKTGYILSKTVYTSNVLPQQKKKLLGQGVLANKL